MGMQLYYPLRIGIREQSEIGWDKLLLRMRSHAWKWLQDYIDAHKPKSLTAGSLVLCIGNTR